MKVALTAIGLIAIAVTTPVGRAAPLVNCYRFKNTNASPQAVITLHFVYQGPVGNGAILSQQLGPGDQWPASGPPWCPVPNAMLNLVGAGKLHDIHGIPWQGYMPVFGSGPLAAPSGIYTIGP